MFLVDPDLSMVVLAGLSRAAQDRQERLRRGADGERHAHRRDAEAARRTRPAPTTTWTSTRGLLARVWNRS